MRISDWSSDVCSSDLETLISDAKGLTKVTEAASVEGRKEGVWQPPAGHQQTPLWPRAAPNMEDVKLPPEYSETATNPKRFAGRPVTGVFNVTRSEERRCRERVCQYV